MAHEIEAAQLASAGGWLKFRRSPQHEQALGTPCANCATPLQGPWCHACGQLGEDFHRSWFRLLGESIEGVFHFDGRVWATLPDLALHPGRLTRRYLEGHRAPQVPPLRLFLVVLLLLFFVGSMVGGRMFDTHGGASGQGHGVSEGPVKLKFADLTPEQRASLNLASGDPKAAPPPAQQAKTLHLQFNAHDELTDEDRARIKSQLSRMNIAIGGGYDPGATTWFRDRASRVVDHPEEFQLLLEAWSERFAFLMLPISALLLGVLFVFQRRFYVFDHLIFSMHSLSFLGLLITVYMIAQKLVGDWADWMLLIPPVHLFLHMRGVYATSIPGTLARMSLLFIGSLIGFVMLMVALIFVGLAGLGG